MKKHFSFLLIILSATCFWACKSWDDRVALSDSSLGRTLFDEINTQADLSKFKDLLVQSGYDKILSSSNNYTVFAPNNKALDALDVSTIKDPDALKAFVENHIAFLAYSMPTTADESRIKLLNNKYNSFAKGVFGTSAVLTANKVVSNGVLHVIDKYAEVLPNLWAYVNANTTDYAQNKSIVSLSYLQFNPEKAIVDSISATTGKPIYRKGTGFESKNSFTDKVFDFADESKQYTYFLLNNDGYTAENKKLNTFYKTSTTDSTYAATSFRTIQDLAVEGYFTQDKLPAILKSKFGVDIPIDKSLITKTIKLSNGIAYILSKVDFKVADKIKTIVVQGEEFTNFQTPLSTRLYAIREKVNPTTNVSFTDLGVAGHGITGFWVRYRVTGVPAAKYKVSWVAENDPIKIWTASSGVVPIVSQKLTFGSPTATTSLAPATFTDGNYNEVLLGEITICIYGVFTQKYLIIITIGKGGWC